MRLIDADELWEKMYRYNDNEGARMPYGDDDSLIHKDSACFLIENAPTIGPEQRWIPCSERLPIGSDVVLLSLPSSIDANGDELVEGVICGHYIGGKNEFWGISDGSTFGYGLVSTRYGTNPTHWMPLPEPYREEK